MISEEIHVGHWYWVEYTKTGDRERVYAAPAKVISKNDAEKTTAIEVYFAGGSGPVRRVWNYAGFNGPITETEHIPKTFGQTFVDIIERVFIYAFAAVALYKLFYLEF